MIARSTKTGVILSVVLVALSAAASAYAQCGARGPAGVYGVAPASHREIDGVVYYFDQRGRPLYKDDYAHYNYPRRFYYRNGGWVLVGRGGGYYARHPGIGAQRAGTNRRAYNGHTSRVHAQGGGHTTVGRHVGAYSGGHSAGHHGAHGHR